MRFYCFCVFANLILRRVSMHDKGVNCYHVTRLICQSSLIKPIYMNNLLVSYLL